MRHNHVRTITVTTLMVGATVAIAQSPALRPTFTPNGVAHVPAFDVPPSEYMSREAVEALKARAALPSTTNAARATTIDQLRRASELSHASNLKSMKARYPTNITEERIAGVRVRVVTPRGEMVDPNRVLVHLHGGAFNRCAEACALEGSIPIAVVGGLKVITVDYRMAPEHTFPAASEDVAAVYRELLKTYKPSQVGIYGCSAGGTLTAQVAAWLPAHGLPQAGAIGVFGAVDRIASGDSNWIATATGNALPPPQPASIRDYFDGVSMTDPMVSPALHPSILAKFPPTLMITGTRATDMSSVIVMHSKLIDVGVPGDLIVGEGMGHCYMVVQHEFPEAQAAYRAIVRFFKTNLG